MSDELFNPGTSIEEILFGRPTSVFNTLAWGSITGTLADQTDLKNALDAKVSVVAGYGLSQNDFTNALKSTYDGYASGKENTGVAAGLISTHESTYPHGNTAFTSTLKTTYDNYASSKENIGVAAGLISTHLSSYPHGNEAFTSALKATYDGYASTISGKENSLGNPSVTGYVLASTTGGVRSWVALPSAGLTNHASLSNLSYALSGHIGFEPTVTKGSLTEATSSVLTITGGTNAIIGSGLTIQVKQAGSGQAGYLSATDWNTFNGKEASGTATSVMATHNSTYTHTDIALNTASRHSHSNKTYLDTLSDPTEYDRFGIKKFYPTIEGGYEWDSQFDVGSARLIASGDMDTVDLQFLASGDGELMIGGALGGEVTGTLDAVVTGATMVDTVPAGYMLIRGSAPRAYIKDTESQDNPADNTLQTFTITAPGTGYTTGDVVKIGYGVATHAAYATVTATAGGITGLTITTRGEGFVVGQSYTIQATGVNAGTGATLTASTVNMATPQNGYRKKYNVEVTLEAINHADVDCTYVTSTGTFTKNSHGMIANTRIFLYNGNGVIPTGANGHTLYYVVNPTTHTFQISLTSGGTAVSLSGANGACSYFDYSLSYAGITCVVRTNHRPDAYGPGTQGYAGKDLFDGRSLIDKEINHHQDNGYKQSEPTYPWGGYHYPLPQRVPIIYKFICRDTVDDKAVHLELWYSLDAGVTWTLAHEFYDYDGWSGDADVDHPDRVGKILNSKLYDMIASVYYRTDGLDSADKYQYLSKWTIREIEKDPNFAPIEPRYLSADDFPTTTGLVIYMAGNETTEYDIMQPVYGNVKLSKVGNGFSIASYDHTQEVNYSLCGVDADGDSNGTSDAALQVTSTQSFSFGFWAYLNDWASSVIDFFTWTYGTTSFVLALNATDLRFKKAGTGSANQVSKTHTLTGSGWHWLGVTRDYTNARTCLYIDGYQVNKAAVATALGGTSTYWLLSYGTNNLRIQNPFLIKDTVLTPIEMMNAYNKGKGRGNIISL